MSATADGRGGRLFLGRVREMASLWAGFEEARAGRGRLFLLRGEAGIGKTALAEALAERAAGAGAAVLWGRCWQGEGAAAYWPWVQIIRACLRRDSGAALQSQPGLASALAQMVPELSGHDGDGNAPRLEPEQARFRLFESIAGFFRAVAAGSPALLLLDDLHWADTESLLLLRFIARELHGTALLIVGTVRDGGAEPQPPVRALLAEVAREARVLALGGLDLSDVHDFVRGRGHAAAPRADLIAALHRITEGNPFFVEEILQLLRTAPGSADAAAGALPVPETVRDVIRRRVDHLPADTRALLSAAAAFGREFDAALLEATLGLPPGGATGHLSAAAAAGVAVALAAPGHHRFAHGLIAETLYEDLSFARQVELHRGAAAALLAHLGTDVDGHLDQLAHHFLRAAPGGDVHAALEWATRAGDQALARLAYEGAAALFGRALAVLREVGAPASEALERQRIELLIRLGTAHARAGDVGAAEEALLDAAAGARARADGAHLARAALALGDVRYERGRADRTLVALLEESLSLLEPEASGLRAHVMARLALCFYLDGRDQREVELSRAAVEVARRSGDGGALASALAARHNALWDPDSAGERLALTSEAQALAEVAGDAEQALDSLGWRIFDLLELGEAAAADAAIADYERRAQELRLPRQRWYASVFRTMQALRHGRWQEAERLAAKGLEVRQVSGAPPSQFFATQMFTLRREQGRLAELGPAIRALAHQYPDMAGWLCAVAVFHCEVGENDAARALFERLAAKEFDDLAGDVNWLAALSMLAEVCARLGDARRAARLYDLLLPCAGRDVVIVGCAAYRGAVPYFLGLLAAASGRWETAAAQFATACERHQNVNAWPLLAWAQHYRAEALRHVGDLATAAGLRDHALAAARTLGMCRLEEEIGRSSAATETASAFRRDGDHWVVSFGGRSVRLNDSRGCAYVAHLLARPGQHISSLDLVSTIPGNAAVDEERARIAVRKAVRVVLRAVAAHAALHQHLRTYLRTGRTCTYAPETSFTWDL